MPDTMLGVLKDLGKKKKDVWDKPLKGLHLDGVDMTQREEKYKKQEARLWFVSPSPPSFYTQQLH